MKQAPISELDWTVHALNIHGTFFERWCAQVFRNHREWRVRSTNYPVRYPPAINLPSKETAVDIWAERPRGQTLLTFVVECKKNNPEFVNWVLFGHQQHEYFNVCELTKFSEGDGWSCKIGTSSVPHENFIADEARETRGNYVQYSRGDKTKTSNAAVADAAYQVAIGVQAIAWEEHARAKVPERKPSYREWLQQILVPIIVTSARLFRADYDPARVNPSTGEVDFSDVTLTELPFAVFNYPIPRHLHDPDLRIDRMLKWEDIENASRLPTIIVTSSHLVEFLDSAFVGNLAV